ncbi:hypothetical protein G5B30_05520 [Sphingobacterium sp. SGG-5]|uniref:hypothetical protein n=1 Tax=Sphingobacterium sp. SGG-5 TaxID=2710881 RepID=UPI0013ED1445|nr:hypothetical protein [Sphingobacterium sp. SGG-5]NGM61375.1 hypothetical protein [Sphingobacterium sp. SGG-5]
MLNNGMDPILPSLVYLSLFLSAFFWLMCLLGIAFFYYQDYRYKRYYAKIYPVLRDFVYENVLIGNVTHHFPIDKLDIEWHKPIVRKVVRRVLHEFIFNIGGEKGKNMCNLFNEMGFDREAQYELRHPAKHSTATIRSLSDLTLMQVHIKDTIVEDLLIDPKTDVRVATYKYLLQVYGEAAFDRVFKMIHGISELDSIDIYQSIIATDYVGEYAFHQWLGTHKTFAVNKLFMNLMVHFQQLNEETLWWLIDTSTDERTQLKAINTLGKLLAYRSEARLRTLYDECEKEKFKIEILKAIGRLGQGHSLHFLADIFEQDQSSILLKKNAFRSLLSQRPYSHPILKDMEKRLSPEDLKLTRYVSHPITHYI